MTASRRNSSPSTRRRPPSISSETKNSFVLDMLFKVGRFPAPRLTKLHRPRLNKTNVEAE